MKTVLNDLMELIRAHRDIYSNLLRLSQLKKEALISANVKELENIINAEELIIIHLGEVERKRQNSVRELAKLTGIDEDSIDIDYIVKLMDSEQKTELEEIKEELKNVLDDVSKNNEINSKLIETQLNYIDLTFELIAGADKSEDYNRQGTHNIEKTPVNVFLDKRI